jgi:putative spermidine/putrescine transport system substrate-binding protein
LLRKSDHATFRPVANAHRDVSTRINTDLGFLMTNLSRRSLCAGIGLGTLSAPFIRSARAASPTTITLVAYPVLFQERYTKAVIEPFMAENPDVKVSYFAQPTSAQMLGTLRAQKAAPQADVVIMDLGVSKAATDEGILAKLDQDEITNIKDLYPNARVPGLAGVVVTFDNLELIYNADLVKGHPDSWLALANPAYAGKVVIPAMPDIIGLSLTLLLDKIEGGTDPMHNLDRGIAELGKIAPNVQTWNPTPEVYAPIVSGQAAIGVGWNARAQSNHDLSGGKLQAVLPKEGSLFQANTINLVAGSPSQAAAKRFINFALSPTAQKAFTELMFYAPSNAKAQISQTAIDRTAVGALDKMIPVDWVELAKIRDSVAEQWRRKVIPLSR